jgi:hypothetical protein
MPVAPKTQIYDAGPNFPLFPAREESLALDKQFARIIDVGILHQAGGYAFNGAVVPFSRELLLRVE